MSYQKKEGTKCVECKHKSAKAGNIMTQQTLETYHGLVHRALYTKAGILPGNAKMPEERAHQHKVNLVLNRALSKTNIAKQAITPVEIKNLQESISGFNSFETNFETHTILDKQI